MVQPKLLQVIVQCFPSVKEVVVGLLVLDVCERIGLIEVVGLAHPLQHLDYQLPQFDPDVDQDQCFLVVAMLQHLLLLGYLVGLLNQVLLLLLELLVGKGVQDVHVLVDVEVVIHHGRVEAAGLLGKAGNDYGFVKVLVKG